MLSQCHSYDTDKCNNPSNESKLPGGLSKKRKKRGKKFAILGEAGIHCLNYHLEEVLCEFTVEGDFESVLLQKTTWVVCHSAGGGSPTDGEILRVGMKSNKLRFFIVDLRKSNLNSRQRSGKPTTIKPY